MKNTLIFKELWKDVCNGEKHPINLTDARELEKWELRDENALALLRSFVIDGMLMQIENETNSWSEWKILRCLILNLNQNGLRFILCCLNKN
jgi:hypothetical protein